MGKTIIPDLKFNGRNFVPLLVMLNFVPPVRMSECVSELFCCSNILAHLDPCSILL